MKILILLFLFPITLFAQNKGATQIASECKKTDDQFELGAKFSEKTYQNKGQCLDEEVFRPAIITSDNDEFLEFANYQHAGKFWTTKISKSQPIEATYVQVLRFNVVQGVTAAHVQYRMTFPKENPIILTAQDNSGETATVSDIIVSFEAARPKGVGYNFALGVLDSFAIIGRITSGEFKLEEKSKEGAIFEQYQIDLGSDKNEIDVLINSIKRSAEYGVDTYYNTLWPNCTTEVFDLIDETLKLQEKGTERFLTVMSNDPIAGPTITALEDRSILIKRVADMRDEIENGSTEAPEEKKPSKFQKKYLPSLPDTPYSLVIINPNEGRSEVIDSIASQVKKDIRLMSPSVLQSVGSSLMLKKSDALELFKASIKGIIKDILKNVEKYESSLPEGEVLQLSTLFTPWNQSMGKKLDPVQSSGIMMRSPFKTFEVPGSKKDLDEVENQYRNVYLSSEHLSLPFYLVGIQLSLHIEKDNSSVSLQLLGRLKKKKKSIEIRNDQLILDGFLIPEHEQKEKQASLVLTVKQKASMDVPTMRVSFGAEGGLNKDTTSNEFGSYLIEDEGEDKNCRKRVKSVPMLGGVFGPRATGSFLYDVILEHNWVNLKIFSIDFDFENFLVSNLDLRIGVSAVECFKFKRADEQAKAQINEMLTEKVGNRESLSNALLERIFTR